MTKTDLELVIDAIPTIENPHVVRALKDAVPPDLLLKFFRQDVYSKIHTNLRKQTYADLPTVRVELMRLTLLATAGVVEKKTLKEDLITAIKTVFGTARAFNSGLAMTNEVGISTDHISLEYIVLFIYLVMGTTNFNTSLGETHE